MSPPPITIMDVQPEVNELQQLQLNLEAVEFQVEPLRMNMSRVEVEGAVALLRTEYAGFRADRIKRRDSENIPVGSRLPG